MLIWIIVLSLVTYRVTRFLIEDSLIDGQRKWLKRKIVGNDYGIVIQAQTPAWRAKLLELSECPYCISVWVALGSVISARLAGPGVPQPFWVWLATAGGSMYLWQHIED